MKDLKINFFTYADEKYYHFVLPYIFSIMKNTTCGVEILISNKQKFYDLYGKKIANIKNILLWDWDNRVKIKQKLTLGVIPNTIRFISAPSTKINYDYTYITDVDMIINKDKFEKAIENNFEGMKRNKTCFFNIKRENREVLSGIHFVKNKEYFPKLSQYLKLFNDSHKENFYGSINALGDEGFLYQFITGTFGNPQKLTLDNVRILPGDHLSPNRNKKYPHIKEKLCKNSDWKYAFSQFDKKFLDLLS